MARHIKRYTESVFKGRACMVESQQGRWMRYSDFQQTVGELKRLRSEIKELKEIRDGLIAHREKLRDERTPGS